MEEVRIAKNDDRDAFLDRSKVQDFGSQLRGSIILPDSELYEEARKLWNGMIDRKPAMIVRPRGVADVIDSVNFAREHNMKLAVKGGGHNVAGRAIMDDGMVIDLSDMRSVSVDPYARVAHAEGGATLGDLDRETQVFGLAAPVGVVSETGIAGLTLHGGLGWQTRKRGMTIDNVLSYDVVTADGQFLNTSADRNPDLFWALRGGGGNYGVVTSFEYQLYPVGPEVWIIFVVYPLERANAAMSFYRDYVLSAPEELMSLSVYGSVPSKEAIPKKFHGQPAFTFIACYTGPIEEAEEVIKPLREFDTPIADLSSRMKFVDAQRILDDNFPDGRLYYWKALYVNGLDDELIGLLSKYTTQRPSVYSSTDVWSLGGAIGRVGPSETPFPYRGAPFLLSFKSVWDDPSESEINIQWARDSYAESEPFSAGGIYLNFPGFVEEGNELVRTAYRENYPRLREIKQRYDPSNLFRGNMNIA